MRRALTIVANFAPFIAPPLAHAGSDWRVLSVTGDVYSEGGDSVVIGTRLDTGTIVQTGTSGHLTLDHNGKTIALGPNTQVRLSNDIVAQIERSSTARHDPVVPHDRDFAPSSPVTNAAVPSQQISGTQVSSPAPSHAQASQAVPAQAPVVAMSPPTSYAPRPGVAQSASSSVAYVSASSPRSPSGTHYMGSVASS